MPSKKSSEAFNFEQSVEQLQTIIERMEQGNLPLEESLQRFEEGIALIRKCQQALEQAQQKVEILTKDQNEEKVKPFEDEA
jgi:exodeoxyribonuclease VII small subunit